MAQKALHHLVPSRLPFPTQTYILGTSNYLQFPHVPGCFTASNAILGVECVGTQSGNSELHKFQNGICGTV